MRVTLLLSALCWAAGFVLTPSPCSSAALAQSSRQIVSSEQPTRLRPPAEPKQSPLQSPRRALRQSRRWVRHAVTSSGHLTPRPSLAYCNRSDELPHVACCCAVAHHVQKKATKHHAHTRPRKSRPSDANRTPPQYPPIPDTPWMTPTEGLTQMTNKQKVSIQVSPSDTAADLNSKLQAAGASAVERFVYSGIELSTTLADCGLKEDSSIEAEVRS